MKLEDNLRNLLEAILFKDIGKAIIYRLYVKRRFKSLILFYEVRKNPPTMNPYSISREIVSSYNIALKREKEVLRRYERGENIPDGEWDIVGFRRSPKKFSKYIILFIRDERIREFVQVVLRALKDSDLFYVIQRVVLEGKSVEDRIDFDEKSVKYIINFLNLVNVTSDDIIQYLSILRDIEDDLRELLNKHMERESRKSEILKLNKKKDEIISSYNERLKELRIKESEKIEVLNRRLERFIGEISSEEWFTEDIANHFNLLRSALLEGIKKYYDSRVEDMEREMKLRVHEIENMTEEYNKEIRRLKEEIFEISSRIFEKVFGIKVKYGAQWLKAIGVSMFGSGDTIYSVPLSKDEDWTVIRRQLNRRGVEIIPREFKSRTAEDTVYHWFQIKVKDNPLLEYLFKTLRIHEYIPVNVGVKATIESAKKSISKLLEEERKIYGVKFE